MARFGRGQPHAPIYLRAPLIAAVTAAATVSPVHVIQTDRAPAYGRHVTIAYVRPSRTSLVPDRLAPQLHIITTTAKGRRTVDVIFLRNPQAPVVVSTAGRQPLVISPERRRISALTPVIFARSLVSLDIDPGKATPQIHVASIGLLRQAIRPKGDAIYLRPPIGSVVPDRLTEQIHVLLQNRPRAAGASLFVLLRNPQAPVAVPDRLAPQIHVVSQVGSRLRARREPILLFLHGGPAPPTFVSLPMQVEDRSGFLIRLLDQSVKRYLVSDQSAVLLDTEDTA